MSFVNTIRQWDEGVAFADKGDCAIALKVLLDIQDINSKIFFNIGCLHLINQELDEAEKVISCLFVRLLCTCAYCHAHEILCLYLLS